jgi:hypothetical protein
MSQEQEQPAEKKIIIDEDWKAQVQAEKEKAESSDEAASPAMPVSESDDTAGAPDQAPARHPMPPASLSFLVSTIATQALMSLGALPHPITQKHETDLDQAKHFIDTLGVLEEKTKGNVTPDEKRQLDAILFDLRMHFVESNKRARTK